MWKDTDLAYLAGIIDGEGSICVDVQSKSEKYHRKFDYYSLRLSVVNTDKNLIDWLQNTFGGSHYKRKPKEGYKVCYTWRLYGHSLAFLIEAVLPYLIIKRPHAQLVKEFRATVGKTGNRCINDEIIAQRRSIYFAIKKINQVGSP